MAAVFGNAGNDPESQISVFVGDLHIHCTEQELQVLFGPYGTISTVKIMRSQETGRNLSYGFVYYLHRDAAVAAINNLDGYLLRGRSLRVKWAAYKDKGNKNNSSNHQPPNLHTDDMDKSPVHFSFISHQTEIVVTEEMLRYMFGKHGKVLDVSIRKLLLDHKHQSGYGFVYYSTSQEGTQSALSAVKAYADFEANGIRYQCHVSHRLDQLLDSNKLKSGTDSVAVGKNKMTDLNSGNFSLTSTASVLHANQMQQIEKLAALDINGNMPHHQASFSNGRNNSNSNKNNKSRYPPQSSNDLNPHDYNMVNSSRQRQQPSRPQQYHPAQVMYVTQSPTETYRSLPVFPQSQFPAPSSYVVEVPYDQGQHPQRGNNPYYGGYPNHLGHDGDQDPRDFHVPNGQPNRQNQTQHGHRNHKNRSHPPPQQQYTAFSDENAAVVDDDSFVIVTLDEPRGEFDNNNSRGIEPSVNGSLSAPTAAEAVEPSKDPRKTTAPGSHPAVARQAPGGRPQPRAGDHFHDGFSQRSNQNNNNNRHNYGNSNRNHHLNNPHLASSYDNNAYFNADNSTPNPVFMMNPPSQLQYLYGQPPMSLFPSPIASQRSLPMQPGLFEAGGFLYLNSPYPASAMSSPAMAISTFPSPMLPQRGLHPLNSFMAAGGMHLTSPPVQNYNIFQSRDLHYSPMVHDLRGFTGSGSTDHFAGGASHSDFALQTMMSRSKSQHPTSSYHRINSNSISSTINNTINNNSNSHNSNNSNHSSTASSSNSQVEGPVATATSVDLSTLTAANNNTDSSSIKTTSETQSQCPPGFEESSSSSSSSSSFSAPLAQAEAAAGPETLSSADCDSSPLDSTEAAASAAAGGGVVMEVTGASLPATGQAKADKAVKFPSRRDAAKKALSSMNAHVQQAPLLQLT